MNRQTVPLKLTVNGQSREAAVPAGMTALEFLRDVLNLKGAKEGCGIGECGACTIQVDGKAVNACLMPAAQLDGREVLTVEGLAREGLHPIQEAFLDGHAVQCGFCTPGLLMSTHALLQGNPDPDREAVTEAVAGNLCRCTGYHHIFSSIDEAVKRNAGESK